jgi:alkylation response protein AidB-like acyl-CoA dehydrogenase
MDFELDDEQVALTRTATEFLRKQMPGRGLDRVPIQPDRQTLHACAQLGWFGLGISEADGGAGASVVEEALLFREIGRALTPGPFLATVLGARVAVTAGDAELAGRIIDGTVPVALGQSHYSGADVRVFDYQNADLLLLLNEGTARLVTKPAVRALVSIDESTQLGSCTLDDAEPVATASSFEALLDVGLVLLAAQLTGIAEATRDTAVAYLSVREQFGRPIGSFQALKHRAADMAVEAEAALSLTTYAALALADGDPGARLYCMSARALAHRAALANARANIQLHGAIGTTFEHDAHFAVKRVHMLGEQLEPVRATLRRLIHEPSPLGAG